MYRQCPKYLKILLLGGPINDKVFSVRLKGEINLTNGGFMKPNFYSEDRENLTIKEEIELLQALNDAKIWPSDDIEELDIPDDYYD